MKEYTIYARQGNAKPYTIGTYKTIASAKLKLYDIISLEIERKRPFFVDNDFFENKYALGSELFYISILERDVKEWRKFSEIDSAKNNLLFLYRSNI